MLTVQTKNDIDKKFLIECPHCRAQYLPCEIFMPEAITGKTTEIVRDSFGKFIYADYHKEDNLPGLAEKFTCEYCNRPFIVEATTVYKTREEAPEADFSTQYVSLID